MVADIIPASRLYFLALRYLAGAGGHIPVGGVSSVHYKTAHILLNLMGSSGVGFLPFPRFAPHESCIATESEHDGDP